MAKVKILGLLVGMVLLFTLPATVSAQRVMPHVFVGTASLDGVAAPEGTAVSAWVAGAEAATGTTGAGGAYTLLVDQGDEESYAAETVSFKIGDSEADETGSWVEGGADELDLSATSGPAPTATPEPTPVPGATGVPGAIGPRGQTGLTGLAGAQGDVGPAGDAGATGATGSTGSIGAQGDQGATGAQGAPGPQGPAGSVGSDASNALGLIALILAIVGIVAAGGAFLLSRRS